jgi:hypothetical protein
MEANGESTNNKFRIHTGGRTGVLSAVSVFVVTTCGRLVKKMPNTKSSNGGKRQIDDFENSVKIIFNSNF